MCIPEVGVKRDSLQRGLDGQRVIDWNHYNRKWSSGVVGELGQWCTESVPAHHRIVIVRREHHHMRMPVANPRREILIRRPHVSEAHHVSPDKFTFGVSGLQTFSDLVRI